MAITTYDQLIAAIAAAQPVRTYEASITTVAGDFFSLWTAGGNPGAGATPASGAGVAPTSSTAGAIPWTNPGGSNTAYLGKFAASAAEIETIILADRLVHTAGLSGLLTSSQTVNSAAITRNYTGGTAYAEGLWLEVYTALGATAATATVSYTNQAGTSGQSGTASIPASAKVGFLAPVSLAVGDYGVQSVQSVTLSADTGTAGSFGVTLTWDICSARVQVIGGGETLSWAGTSLPIIQPSACLAYKVLCSTTSSGIILTELALAQG